MNRHKARRRWLMPWLAPLAFSALYLVEFWREGVFADPLVLLTQIVFAAPLVIAGTRDSCATVSAHPSGETPIAVARSATVSV